MSKSITYRFSVLATLPLTDDPQDSRFFTEAIATSAGFQRDIENKMAFWLRRVEGDHSVELLDYTVEDDDAA